MGHQNTDPVYGNCKPARRIVNIEVTLGIVGNILAIENQRIALK